MMAAIAGMAVNFLPLEGIKKYIALAIFVVSAWVIHFIFLTLFQTESCDGVKSFKSIALGSLLGTVFVAICLAMPLHMDWARLAFSDMFMTHYPLLSEPVEKFAKKFVTVMRGGDLSNTAKNELAAKQKTPNEIAADQEKPQEKPQETPQEKPQEKPQETPPITPTNIQDILALQNMLKKLEYDKQTVYELVYAGPLWAFMGGAVGIGLGNLVSGTQCS